MVHIFCDGLREIIFEGNVNLMSYKNDHDTNEKLKKQFGYNHYILSKNK
jgi:hypothetical protein